MVGVWCPSVPQLGWIVRDRRLGGLVVRECDERKVQEVVKLLAMWSCGRRCDDEPGGVAVRSGLQLEMLPRQGDHEIMGKSSHASCLIFIVQGFNKLVLQLPPQMLQNSRI